ncbi:MAG: MazG nucleotide pyrophosphohydrolase domain-containing protein [Planctomycetota bacterium]
MSLPADAGPGDVTSGETLRGLQARIRRLFGAKDEARGIEGTFMWFSEEVGELAAALREDDRVELGREFADVLAWLATLANVTGIDLAAAVAEKYGTGCPRCDLDPCDCPPERKP